MSGSGLVLVTGAGGFIGGHLVAELLQRGRAVRAADIKPLPSWWQNHSGAQNRVLDLRRVEDARLAVEGVTDVYNLASDMGGMGFIERNKARCMLSVLINTHLLAASRDAGVSRYFFASSACVYPAVKQDGSLPTFLREEDVYPADPEDGYGWEKLFGERLCRHFREDFGLETRVARFHNVYGPLGTWEGGREKAPAAVCRKVAEAMISGPREIEIWGDGSQIRTFMYISDAVDGAIRLMESSCAEPLNVGSDEPVTVNGLVDLVEEIAGVRLSRCYDPSAPRGVRSRGSDNTRIRSLLGWVPSTPLKDGLARTWPWILERVKEEAEAGEPSRAIR